MQNVRQKLILEFQQFIATERPRFILWMPVLLMLGIGWYFTLDNEPGIGAGIQLLSGGAILLLLVWRHRMRWLVMLFLLVALGFASAQFRAQWVATPLLSEELRNRFVEGTIDEIEPVEKREKLVLSNLYIEDMPKKKTPTRVRISYRAAEGTTLRVGDHVHMKANLYPLPSPVMPGSYDFARHFYFRGIGGNGFAFRPPEVLTDAKQSGIWEWIGNLRHSIGERMRAGMPGATGTVAAAMTIGETGPIPEDVKDELRNSGLAHMLSISGLHLSIFAGIMFFSVRLLLTLYPPLALRVNAKKIAAIFALIGAFIYLLLSGWPVPAQRAFIMVSFLFLAMLLDRRGITLRTLSLAAIFILLVFPEAMFGASFQMSFAATLAIISLYERFGLRLYPAGASWQKRFFYHGLGIMVTSLAVTIATAPFIIYNFNRFALLGLLSNMVVIPLATFLIMPGMVLSLLLMPLGLEWLGYQLLGSGTDIMLIMGKWVSELPYASISLLAPSNIGLMISAFGLLWLCLMIGRWRLLGFPAMAIGMATMIWHVPVDMLISEDARQVVVRLDDGRYTALKGTARSFTVKNWLRSEGQDVLVPLKQSGIVCDRTLCTYRKNGKSVVFVKTPDSDDGITRACALTTDVLIAWRYLHKESCAAPIRLIGRGQLEAYGAQALWLDAKQVEIKHARTPEYGKRLWQPAILSQEREE